MWKTLRVVDFNFWPVNVSREHILYILIIRNLLKSYCKEITVIKEEEI